MGQEHKQLSVFAVVNGEQISRKFIGQQTVKRFGGEVLESIINKKLIELECTRLGILVTDKHVDMEIEVIAKKIGMSVDRWLDLLQNERDIPIQKYREEIIWPPVALRRLAHKQLTVEDSEIQREIESQFGPQVQVRMIVLKDPQEAQKIKEAVSADPESFASLAVKHSIDINSASSGGLVQPIRRHLAESHFQYRLTICHN